MWKIKQVAKTLPELNDPILLEGLPGVGNVGKVVVDFIVDELKAEKLFEFTSHSLPHCVFVNEDNLVRLTSISIYYKTREGKRDLLLLAGDAQPIDEVSSYAFSEKVLDVVEQLRGKEVVTLGGVGLGGAPKNPKVYCTGNSKEIVKKYCVKGVNKNVYGVVGPIIGVSGLLLGLASERNIQGASLLAETLGHPVHIGMRGAKALLGVLNNKLELDVDLSKLDNEMKKMEAEVEISGILDNLLRKDQKVKREKRDYIG